jgi:hypothetical protein
MTARAAEARHRELGLTDAEYDLICERISRWCGASPTHIALTRQFCS